MDGSRAFGLVYFDPVDVFGAGVAEDRVELLPQFFDVVYEVGCFHGQGRLVVGGGQLRGVQKSVEPVQRIRSLLQAHVVVLPSQVKLGPLGLDP